MRTILIFCILILQASALSYCKKKTETPEPETLKVWVTEDSTVCNLFYLHFQAPDTGYFELYRDYFGHELRVYGAHFDSVTEYELPFFGEQEFTFKIRGLPVSKLVTLKRDMFCAPFCAAFVDLWNPDDMMNKRSRNEGTCFNKIEISNDSIRQVTMLQATEPVSLICYKKDEPAAEGGQTFKDYYFQNEFKMPLITIEIPELDEGNSAVEYCYHSDSLIWKPNHGYCQVTNKYPGAIINFDKKGDTIIGNLSTKDWWGQTPWDILGYDQKSQVVVQFEYVN